jgi:hypothetical protein
VDTIPTPLIVTYSVVLSPIWVPCLAVWGAYHGIKAAFVHGVKPAFGKIAGASRK